MTAEVAVANRAAIALAADSAVTVSSLDSQKVMNGASKLFQLSHSLPVGFMFYGDATLGFAPFESLVKSFRPRAETVSANSLSDYGDAFWHYVDTDVPEFTAETRERVMIRLFVAHIIYVVRRVEKQIQDEQMHGGRKKPKALATSVIKELRAGVRDLPQLGTPTPAQVRAAMDPFTTEMDARIHQYLDPYGVDAATCQRLHRIIVDALSRIPHFGGFAGVVIAGYEPGALYPSICHYRVAGFVAGKLCRSPAHVMTISDQNTALLMPFAQREMVTAFMEGIDPVLAQNILSLFRGSLEAVQSSVIDAASQYLTATQSADLRTKLRDVPERITTRLDDTISQFRGDVYANPVIEALGFLPKAELANAAEALVNLTAFRRRVTLDLETVGGDVDVAVISPGDGFVWIKRKHYFAPERNPAFFMRFES